MVECIVSLSSNSLSAAENFILSGLVANHLELVGNREDQIDKLHDTEIKIVGDRVETLV